MGRTWSEPLNWMARMFFLGMYLAVRKIRNCSVWPNPFTRAVYAGFPTLRHPHLAALNRNSQCLPVILLPPFPVTLCALIIVKLVIPRRPTLLLAAHQELLSPPSLPKKCWRRKRRQARWAANQNRAPSSAAPVTPDERWANERAGSSGATQPLLEDSDPTSRMRTAVYPHLSIHSQTIAHPPISAANENSPFHLGLELGEFPGLYKPAVPDPRQDLTARPLRVNNSGSGISSPHYLQPYTKPFSGRPARPYMTCPTREAGGALRSRSGIVYPLLPRAQRPDTNVAIDAALPEPAAVERQDLPPTIVEIGITSQPQTEPSARRRTSRKPSRKRRRNRSAGVFRPPKRSPPQGHWCDWDHPLL